MPNPKSSQRISTVPNLKVSPRESVEPTLEYPQTIPGVPNPRLSRNSVLTRQSRECPTPEYPRSIAQRIPGRRPTPQSIFCRESLERAQPGVSCPTPRTYGADGSTPSPKPRTLPISGFLLRLVCWAGPEPYEGPQDLWVQCSL